MILVTGATGLNGGELVRRLSARDIPVRALVHVAAARAKGLSSLPKAEIVEGDMARPETLAEVAAAVLTGAGHEGKIYPLTGPEALSMAEVAQKLSAATGKTVRYVNVTPEEARRAQVAAGMAPYLVDALAELFAERRKGKEAQVSSVIPRIFGRQATSFDEFTARNAAILRGEKPVPMV